jgi:hypothetical protein
MIATLNPFRDTLEELGSVLGVIDAVSGPVVLGLKWRIQWLRRRRSCTPGTPCSRDKRVA